MKIKNKLALLLPIFAVMAMSVAYLVWEIIDQDRVLQCRARVYSKVIANAGDKSRAVDVFLAMNGDGKGYLLVSGSYSGTKTPQIAVDSFVDFTYTKEGKYYSIHLGQRSLAVIELFEVLKYDDVMATFINVGNDNYIVSLPMKTLMVCTEEKLK